MPEKAVETLELIKTIFNAESFAFVLALDEEVVERGIGHRYKDYTLVGKKPEMPITGFEYLEKIVHLPFRLPALTQAQAFNFLACYEEKLIAQRAPYSKKRDCWFQPKILSIPSSIKEFASREYTARQTTEDFSGWGDEKLEQNIDSRNLSLRRVTQAESITLNLAGLVIGSFNAFVPRKLIRVVELFHQVLDVLDIRNTSHMFTVGGEPKKTIDPRIAMANILLQLFQPELQRTLRRSKTGFDVLLNAFAPQTTDGGNMQLSSSKSDADLLHWAIYMAGGRQPPISLRSATMRMADITDEGQRYSSQRLLLVIVERLLEHRSIQRHAFDPLKLFETLQMSTHNGSLPLPDDTRWMSAMLSASADTMGDSIDAVLQVLTMQHQVAAVVADVTSAQSQTSSGVGQISNPKNNINIASVSNIDALFLALISPEEPEQKRVAEIAGLKEGQILNKAAVFKLVSAIETRFLIDIVEHGEDSDDSKSRKLRLLNGLKYLAPYIAKTDGGHLWSMVQGIVDVDKIPIEPKLRARWHDVRAALGQDNRFEGKYALPKRTDGDAPEAPAGFVLCPIPESGEYVFDDGDEMRPQKRQYYISRYAVTVAQYAAYVAADGYKDQALWEASHRDAWLWRTGEFDSSKTIEDKGYKEWLARRPADLRHQPMDWTEQLANLNRPVTGVTWFEATVYAAWLEVQRQKGDGGHDWGTLRDPPYRLRLPTEGEWERAARAGGAGKFPWGDDEADIDQRANVNDKVGHATTVGSYPPNALGLYDMAGNVWQWQANLYTNPYENKLILPKTPLKIGKDYQTSDTPARRGGSWFIHPDFARCSSRNWSPPDFWLFNLGFRLVLSLADFES